MIEDAIKTARKSESLSHRVGCVITNRKGKIISTGFNSTTKTHPIQVKFANMSGEPDKMFLHAEIHALVKLVKSKETPHTIYVARVTKGDNIRLAKPCPICELALREAGVKNVIYTDNNGTTEEYEIK